MKPVPSTCGSPARALKPCEMLSKVEIVLSTEEPPVVLASIFSREKRGGKKHEANKTFFFKEQVFAQICRHAYCIVPELYENAGKESCFKIN